MLDQALAHLRADYRPALSVADFVFHVTHRLIRITGSEGGSAELDPHQGFGFGTPLSWTQGPAPDSAEGILAIPLYYQYRHLGWVRLHRPRFVTAPDAGEFRSEIGKWMVGHIARLLTSEKLRRERHVDVQIVGASDALTKLDTEIQRTSAASLPVMMVAAPGLREYRIARMIHTLGPWRDGPFIEMDCRCWRGNSIAAICRQIHSLLARGFRATWFFPAIDSLDTDSQIELAKSIECIPEHQRDDLRLISSCRHDPRGLTRELSVLFDYLRVTVPDLRSRPDDIQPIAEYLLGGEAFHAGQISSEAIEMLRLHSWPENVDELSGILVRAARLCAGEVIRVEDILKAGLDRERCVTTPAAVENGADLARIRDKLIGLAGPRVRRFDEMHPALRRAIVYLAEHVWEPVSATELARHSLVSSVHLAYLFRAALGMTFKELMARFRVDEAKVILLEYPEEKVTTIAERLGYSEVRQFHRTFRRVAGCAPQQYRDQFRAEANS